MRKQNRKFDPAEHFAVQDIALWTTSLTRGIEYVSSLHDGDRCAFQSMRSVSANLFVLEPQGDGTSDEFLRVLVSLGVRMIPRENASSVNNDDAVYTLLATFAADYEILKAPSEKEFSQFVDFNAVHNVWPFWRQHVFDTLRRASLPVAPVPFFAGGRRRKPTIATEGGQKALTEPSDNVRTSEESN